MILRVGYSGPEVARLQARLGLVPDGLYGIQTQTAVLAFQRAYGLEDDGEAGPLTLRALGLMPAPATPGDPLDRALSAVGKGIAYKLGHGGWRPGDALPGTPGTIDPKNKHSGCDCSGFVSWCLSVRRDRTIVPSMWGISTDSIHRDATTAQRHFERIAEPVRGCIAVYPDVGKRQGHVAIVTDPAKHRVVDCGSSSGGITERVLHTFWRRPDTVWCRWLGAF